SPHNAPVSYMLTREHTRYWKNAIREIKHSYPYVEWWPCMYCHKYVVCKNQVHRSRFRCETAGCVGKGKLQVTCFWDIR
ncbi:hypothetical protein BDW02DRAFT_471995, partial [Decorospora gaudefroyi]